MEIVNPITEITKLAAEVEQQIAKDPHYKLARKLQLATQALAAAAGLSLLTISCTPVPEALPTKTPITSPSSDARKDFDIRAAAVVKPSPTPILRPNPIVPEIKPNIDPHAMHFQKFLNNWRNELIARGGSVQMFDTGGSRLQALETVSVRHTPIDDPRVNNRLYYTRPIFRGSNEPYRFYFKVRQQVNGKEDESYWAGLNYRAQMFGETIYDGIKFGFTTTVDEATATGVSAMYFNNEVLLIDPSSDINAHREVAWVAR